MVSHYTYLVLQSTYILLYLISVIVYMSNVKRMYVVLHSIKAVPLLPCRCQGERKYNTFSYLTSELDGVSGQRHDPAELYPGKDPRYPLYRRQDGPQSWSGHRGQRKISFYLSAIEPRSS
jgi:hypothetical protein